MTATRMPHRAYLIRTALVAMVLLSTLGSSPVVSAGPLDDAETLPIARFDPTDSTPPVLQGRLQGLASSLYIAGIPQVNVYATTAATGKARLWLLRTNALAGDVTVP